VEGRPAGREPGFHVSKYLTVRTIDFQGLVLR
jgi:hypothetical protein